MTIDRIAMPSKPGGRIQKAIPKKHTRPSISIGAASAGVEVRVWRVTAVNAVKVGDIVAEFGRVTNVNNSVIAPAYGSGLKAEDIANELTWVVTLTGTDVGHGAPVRSWHGSATVYAFVTEERA